jgi:hypothetical protein
LLDVQGASQIEIDAQGNLLLHTRNGGLLTQEAPVAFQDVNGVQQAVSCWYVMEGHQVGLAWGAYDRSRPLIIDPSLTYSTYYGGSGSDSGNAIALDSSNEAFIAGSTTSTNFPTHSPYQSSNAGGTDAFVVKLNAAGSAVLYATYLGGSGNDGANAVAVDGMGNIYLGGSTYSSSFPTLNAAQSTYGGSGDGFVTELNSSGSALVFSTFVGGSGNDVVNGLTASPSVLVAGTTSSTNLPTTTGAYQTTYGGGSSDAFVASYAPNGNLSYSTYLGGSGTDAGYGIATPGGNAYVTGSTTGSFPTTAGAFQTTYGGGSSDAFVTEINGTGSGLTYSSYLGGSGADVGYALFAESGGTVDVTGQTFSTDFPLSTPGGPPPITPFQATAGGGGDAFVAKISSGGSSIAWASYLGGSGADAGRAIAISSTRPYMFVGGSTASSDFPTSGTALQSSYGGGSSDGFVAMVDAGGTPLYYSSYVGGSGSDAVYGLAVDSSVAVWPASVSSCVTRPKSVILGTHSFSRELRASAGSASALARSSRQNDSRMFAGFQSRWPRPLPRTGRRSPARPVLAESPSGTCPGKSARGGSCRGRCTA